MADAPTLSPEVSRSVLALARTLVAAARSWALYPPEDPAVRGSLDGLRAVIADVNGGQINGWEPDGRGDFTWAVIETADPEAACTDPPEYM